MAYARKVDRNHAAIRSALRFFGWTVLDVSALPGFVDLVCVRRRVTEFVEVKDRKGKLTAAQVRLHAELANAGVTVKVIRSVEDCEAL